VGGYQESHSTQGGKGSIRNTKDRKKKTLVEESRLAWVALREKRERY